MNASILILDDDVPVRRSLASYLSDMDYQTFEAADAEEALDFLGGRQTDLVIVDLRLPGMDGVHFIHTARRCCPGVLFVIYTGSPMFAIPQEFSEAAEVSSSVFFKPLRDLSVLSDEIARMLRTRGEV